MTINRKPDPSELHKKFDEINTTEKISIEKFQYEFLETVDSGWIPCNVLEIDTEKELLKVEFYRPKSEGWMDITGANGIYDQVVEMWRVRLRED